MQCYSYMERGLKNATSSGGVDHVSFVAAMITLVRHYHVIGWSCPVLLCGSSVHPWSAEPACLVLVSLWLWNGSTKRETYSLIHPPTGVTQYDASWSCTILPFLLHSYSLEQNHWRNIYNIVRQHSYNRHKSALVIVPTCAFPFRLFVRLLNLFHPCSRSLLLGKCCCGELSSFSDCSTLSRLNPSVLAIDAAWSWRRDTFWCRCMNPVNQADLFSLL